MEPNTPQRSVATYVRCGVILDNLQQNLPVKEFWKSVKIWQRYGIESGV